MARTFIENFRKTLLSGDELATIERDLSFRPAERVRAKTLTAEQIETFNRDGFLRPLPAFDANRIAELRRLFDAVLDEAMAEGGDSYSLIDPHLRHGWIYDLMFEPRFVDPIKDLIGPDLVCWSTHAFVKIPHDERHVAWHQDAYYWPFTPARTVTVWLAVDDADHGNACMQFVTGSHRLGKVPHRLTREDEKNVLRVTVDGIETYGRIADVALRAGEMSLHSDMLLHGSGPNRSDRRRFGITFRYADADVRDLRDWSKFGVLVCGEDRRGQWGNPPRPGQ
ncbi:MAG: phytanoyl-CoA dioxygenase family protein [Phycisphaeraceae bacterium]|nr:phytanoyl-CoA dioxygenase family protein [Phycisphaeraceae bacterium]